MAPREGHLQAMICLFGYLMNYDKGILFIDPKIPDIREEETVLSGHNWSDFCLDAFEDLPSNMLTQKEKMTHLTCFVDADHARDKVTMKSVTGKVLLINSTPICWLCRRQKTVETSTYGSKLAVAHIATDLLIEWRYKLRMLGVKLESSSWMIRDNMSVMALTIGMIQYVFIHHHTVGVTPPPTTVSLQIQSSLLLISLQMNK